VTDTTQRPAEPDVEPRPVEAKGQPIRLALLVAGILGLGFLLGLSMLIVILAIIVMVFFHELGHYLTAKAAGMKVTEFFIGAGPKLWSFRRGETEYGVKAIPVLAYVRIIGMTNLEEVPPEDEARTYRQKPYWRRLSVATAGSAAHFAMALICLVVLFAGTGVPGGRLFAKAETLDTWVVGTIAEDSAAATAGLEPGDEIISIDGRSTSTFGDVRDIVQPKAGESVEVVFARDGERQTIDAELGSVVRDGERVGLFGITADFPTVRYGPIEATRRAGLEFGTVMKESVVALGRFFSPSGISDFAAQVADGDNDGPVVGDGEGSGGGETSTDGEGRLISIVGATRIGAEATDTGVAGLLAFLVMLNVFIGIFNLVPLLPLDGGHVAGALWEGLRRGVARVFKRPDPGPFDMAKLLPVTYAVAILLMGMGALLIYADIVKPVDLFG
jgi:membrane-associated protease RseP (regulator of RpoE activity)